MRPVRVCRVCWRRNHHEMRMSRTVTLSKQKTERCASHFSDEMLIGCGEELPGSSCWQSVWQQQSDEWQLTGLCMLMMCTRAAASGQQAKWAKHQQQFDPNIQTNALHSERSIWMCWIIDIRKPVCKVCRDVMATHEMLHVNTSYKVLLTQITVNIQDTCSQQKIPWHCWPVAACSPSLSLQRPGYKSSCQHNKSQCPTKLLVVELDCG